ncbi:MAG: aminopeptidase P N-terminal domain-containing protein, partial [Desulfovibrionales bacterium]|nr:aminopeptidase P N-terminal domain-containing protein [Desulfovibrionales bacterium]
MRYNTINNSLFINNRERFADSLPNNSINLVLANLRYPKNGDMYYPFRQDSDFFYLTGIEFPEALLVIIKKEDEVKEILFTKETNEKIMLWDGPRPNKEEANQISGISDVRWYSEFDSFIKSIDNSYEHCSINLNANRRVETNMPSAASSILQQYQEYVGQYKWEDNCSLIHQLRLIKSDIEIELLRKAISITHKAYLKVLEELKPKMREFEIEAIMRREMYSEGAQELSFEPIMAAGANACILHYINNDDVCKDGDLILMDFGAEYANYAGDCSRTIPINGKYTRRQRQVYEAV